MDGLPREIATRLVAGVSLDGLGLGKVDGRWDLRGHVLANPVSSRPVQVGGTAAMQLSGIDHARRVTWEGLDLRESSWPHLRMTGVSVVDCRFDGASLRDLRVWGSDFADSTFEGADLRDSSTGGRTGTFRPRDSTWRNISFARCDLRSTAHSSELFLDCDFDRARLDEVNFDASRHIRSRFAGPVRDVFFYRRTRFPTGRRAPDNDMDRVDMSGAEVIDCSFWGLELPTLVPPPAEKHAVFLRKFDVARHALEELARRGWSGRLVEMEVRMRRLTEEGPRTSGARGIVHLKSLGRDGEERGMARDVLLTAIALAGEGT